MFRILAKVEPMTRINKFIPLFIFSAITFAVYYKILGHTFLINWDDTEYVTANPAIMGFTLEHIKAVFSSYYGGNYAPVQMLSYMFDYSIWGLDPRGFLLTNILLHITNGWLLYRLLKSCFDMSEGVALSAALIFLCHPVQVESVAWVSQRKNLLSATFFLMSFISYIRYATTAEPAKRTIRLYGLSLLLFVVSILTKSVTIILFPVILLFDICHVRHKSLRRVLLDKLPYLAITLAAGLITLLSQNPHSGGGMSATYHGESGAATAFTMLTVLPRYFRLLLYPTGLSPVYEVPIRTTLIDFQVTASLIFLIALGAAGIWLFRRHRDLFFWYAFFFIAMLPVSQIVPIVTLMNDRYLYFPMFGFSTVISASVLQAVQQSRVKPPPLLLQAVVVAVITGLGVASHYQSRIWHDSITLWKRAIRQFPESSSAWTGLATSHHAGRETSAALQAYLNAVNLNPSNRIALNNLALMYLSLGKPDKAEEYALHLIRSNPDYALGFSTLGICYLSRGETDLAELAGNKALELNPRLAAAWNLKGDIALVRTRYDEAERNFGIGYGLDRNAADRYHYSLATVEAALGNQAAAIDHLRLAYQNGLSVTPETVRTNPHLAVLRGHPGFERIITEGYARNQGRPVVFK